MTDDDVDEFVTYLRQDNERLRAELGAAQDRERQLLGLLGYLREGAGALWIVCRAAVDEADQDATLPADTFQEALDDIERRMQVLTAHFGHHGPTAPK